jgi:hypothetical protein
LAQRRPRLPDGLGVARIASPARLRLAVFNYYDQPAKLSTDLLLPCSGSGRVAFVPIGGGSTARPGTVAVTFQGEE